MAREDHESPHFPRIRYTRLAHTGILTVGYAGDLSGPGSVDGLHERTKSRARLRGYPTQVVTSSSVLISDNVGELVSIQRSLIPEAHAAIAARAELEAGRMR